MNGQRQALLCQLAQRHVVPVPQPVRVADDAGGVVEGADHPDAGADRSAARLADPAPDGVQQLARGEVERQWRDRGGEDGAGEVGQDRAQGAAGHVEPDRVAAAGHEPVDAGRLSDALPAHPADLDATVLDQAAEDLRHGLRGQPGRLGDARPVELGPGPGKRDDEGLVVVPQMLQMSARRVHPHIV